MHQVATGRLGKTQLLPAGEDEIFAGRSAARLLITASTGVGVEALARRIHAAGVRAELPFVQVRSGDLPGESQGLRETWSHLLSDAAGGSVFISDVEQMAPAVQDQLIDLLAELEYVRVPSTAVRVISGTTVSLLDGISAGTFSERLFYRLNVIHLMTEDLAQGAKRVTTKS